MNFIGQHLTMWLMATGASLFSINANAQQADVEYLNHETPPQWVLLPIGQKPDSTNVLIQGGHTVSLDQDAHIKNLWIEENAILNAITSANGNHLYKLITGASAVRLETVILNDGTLGDNNKQTDGIGIEIPPANSKFTLTGSGHAYIGYLYPIIGNHQLTININQNAVLSGTGMIFSAIPVQVINPSDDNITLTIAAQKTVSLTNPDAQFHAASAIKNGGKYTYHIQGTLDLSATENTQYWVPATESESSLTSFAISGTVKFGKALSLAYPIASKGKIDIDVLNGGVADATATTLLHAGIGSFTTHPGGVLIRRVSNADVMFPVRAAGAATPSPLLLRSMAGTSDLAIGVKNQFDQAVPNSNKVVNKQWSILGNANTTAKLSVTPYWLTADAAAGFEPHAPVSLIRYDDPTSAWVETKANLAGMGTLAAPYTATATDVMGLGNFTVQNGEGNPPTHTVSLYPNPVHTLFTVSFPEATGNGNLYITASNGSKLLSAAIAKGQTEWSQNISTWIPGVYFLVIENGGKRTTLKFVKQ